MLSYWKPKTDLQDHTWNLISTFVHKFAQVLGTAHFYHSGTHADKTVSQMEPGVLRPKRWNSIADDYELLLEQSYMASLQSG